MAKLVSMARTAKDKAEIVKEQDPSGVDSVPEYPWGLCLCLDEESLSKLGIADLPKPGAIVTITASAKVTSVRMSADEGEVVDRQGVDLQITDMAIDDGSRERAVQGLYPSATPK